jgi:hypothetical protein
MRIVCVTLLPSSFVANGVYPTEVDAVTVSNAPQARNSFRAVGAVAAAAPQDISYLHVMVALRLPITEDAKEYRPDAKGLIFDSISISISIS